MYQRYGNLAAFCVLIMFLLLTITAGVMAGSAPGGKEPLGPCETPNDDGTIGTVHAMLGEAVGVPVFIESDDCINNYKFIFELDLRLDFDSIQWGTCPWVDAPTWDPDLGVLTVEHSTGGDCFTPDGGDVFFTIWVNTHCGEFHDIPLPIEWGSSDPFDPDIFLGHAACNRDPIVMYDGGVQIDPIDIALSIDSDTVLISEEFTLSVNMKTNVDFSSFNHFVIFDPEYLQLTGPIVTPSPWTDGYLNYSAPFHVIMMSGNDRPEGYGIPDPGEFSTLYDIHFKAISPIDDITTVVKIIDGSEDVDLLDCGQQLASFVDFDVDSGYVVVPPYRAEFDLGDVVWSNDNTCEFQVPIYLDNNYPVYKFNFSFEYAAQGDPLDFVGIVPHPDLQYQALNCTDYGRGDYEFGQVTFLASGGNEFQPVDEPVQIGALIFRASTPVSGTYPLNVLEFGCDTEFETWVKTWDDVRQEMFYAYSAPQTDFSDGSITFEAPSIHVTVPDANAARHCDKWGNCDEDTWATTPIYVESNVDLNQLTFRVEWDADDYCVETQDLAPGVSVVINEEQVYAEWTITDISAAAGWKWYGTLRFENGLHQEKWGSMDVTSISYVEPCPSENPVPTSSTAGGIHLYAVPLSYMTCKQMQGDEPDRLLKDAAVPLTYNLSQNRPNPFNASTMIEYSLPHPGNVTIDVYNVMGQRVVRVLDEYAEAGNHAVQWNGKDQHGTPVASGIYFYRLQADEYVASKKMVLLK